LIRLGEFATLAGRSDDAKTFFDAAIARSPDDATAFFGRAKLRNRVLDHPRTISDASRAIELIMHKLERMPASLEPNSTAYQILDYIDAAPERRWLLTMLAEAHFLRANAYNVIRDFDKAEADGRVLISLDPDDYQKLPGEGAERSRTKAAFDEVQKVDNLLKIYLYINVRTFVLDPFNAAVEVCNILGIKGVPLGKNL